MIERKIDGTGFDGNLQEEAGNLLSREKREEGTESGEGTLVWIWHSDTI